MAMKCKHCARPTRPRYRFMASPPRPFDICPECWAARKKEIEELQELACIVSRIKERKT